MILLEGPENGYSVGGASFKVIFQKSRAMRTEETQDRSVTLNESGQWEYEILSVGKAYEVVKAIRSREYCTQAEVAEGLGWSKSEVSKQLRKAREHGIISTPEISECFADAKYLDEDLDDDDEF
jgi:VCBS repeat-containing protein